MPDETVIRSGKPLHAIDEIVYSRPSATRGFIEPIRIIGIEFDSLRKQWVYSWTYNPKGGRIKASPVKLVESQVVGLPEALQLQLGVLWRQLSDIQTKQASYCQNQAEKVAQPGVPKYGPNEVVFLAETSEVTGHLESMRIANLLWDETQKEWLYGIHISRRPGRNSTVGDRGDMTHEWDLVFAESQLCGLCEALQLAFGYLTRAIQTAESRLARSS